MKLCNKLLANFGCIRISSSKGFVMCRHQQISLLDDKHGFAIVKALVISFLFILQLQAQNVENYLNYRAGLEEYKGDVKCATRYELQIKFQHNDLTAHQKNLLKSIQSEPVRSESLTKNHFTLHWDEMGDHAVPITDNSGNGIPDYIDSAASILEHVWDVEINQMGYSAPPQQNGQPVTTYHIYFTDFAYYGVTTPGDVDIAALAGDNRTSFIELENDYTENYFATKGLDGLRVTAAHEFHHAIQLGYIYRESDFYFFEMTATWLEDVLYTNINDYFNYLNSLFGNVGYRTFSDLPRYGNCLYNHMLADKHGNEIISDIWDEIRTHSAIEAISLILSNPKYNDSWVNSINDYGVWLYFTGDRARPAIYFPEGDFYPQVNIRNNNTYQFADSLKFTENTIANSFKYFKVHGNKDQALQSSLKSELATNAGHALFSNSMISEFISIDDTLNGFITSEDSVIVLVSNAENFNDNFSASMRIVENFVQIDSLKVEAKEGRNILTWSSFYEILNKQWIINRKKQGQNFQMIYTIAGNEYSTNEKQYTYVDSDIEEGINYEYKLDVVFQNDSIQIMDSLNVFSLSPSKFRLLQNYPNPFNNESTIIVELLNSTEYSLNIYDILGRKIKTLQVEKFKEPGFHEYKWYGKNENGNVVSSGVYFAKLKNSHQSNTIKMVYLR